jgi:Spy/CpxP family protein refolding chaperone
MLKRIFLITIAFLLAAAVSLAAHDKDKKEKFAKLQAELGLSDAQVAQLQQKFNELSPSGEEMERRAKALNEQIRTLESSANPDQQALNAKRSEREALTQEWHEKVRAIYKSVLTEEQFAKLDQMHSNHDKESKEGHEQKEKEHRDRMI